MTPFCLKKVPIGSKEFDKNLLGTVVDWSGVVSSTLVVTTTFESFVPPKRVGNHKKWLLKIHLFFGGICWVRHGNEPLWQGRWTEESRHIFDSSFPEFTVERVTEVKYPLRWLRVFLIHWTGSSVSLSNSFDSVFLGYMRRKESPQYIKYKKNNNKI